MLGAVSDDHVSGGSVVLSPAAEILAPRKGVVTGGSGMRRKQTSGACSRAPSCMASSRDHSQPSKWLSVSASSGKAGILYATGGMLRSI